MMDKFENICVNDINLIWRKIWIHDFTVLSITVAIVSIAQVNYLNMETNLNIRAPVFCLTFKNLHQRATVINILYLYYSFALQKKKKIL